MAPLAASNGRRSENDPHIGDLAAGDGAAFGTGASLTGTVSASYISTASACAVHMDGRATKACQTPMARAEGKAITTVDAVAGPVVDAGAAPAEPQPTTAKVPRPAA